MSDFRDRIKINQLKKIAPNIGNKIEKDYNEQQKKSSGKTTAPWKQRASKSGGGSHGGSSNKNKSQNVVDDNPNEVIQRLQEEKLNRLIPGLVEKVRDKKDLGQPKPQPGFVPKSKKSSPVISCPNLINVYSREQWIEKTKSWNEQTKQNEQILKQNIQNYETIDTSKKYEINLYGKPFVVSGTFVKGFYKKDITKAKQDLIKNKQNLSSSEKLYQDAISLPKGTKVEETKEGFVPVIPETEKLSFSKTQLKKYEKSPLGIQQIQEFVFGIQSTGLAILSPISDVLGVKKEFDIAASFAYASSTSNPFDKKSFAKEIASNVKSVKYGAYYVSPLDFAFEPIGIAPKGSSDILKKYPVFTAGGIAGEVLQGYAISKAIGGGGKVVGRGVRGVVKRVPKVYTQVSKKFPRVFGTIATESGKRVGSTSGKFISKVGRSRFGKNIYNWSARGYKPGRGLVFKSGKLTEKGGYRIQQGRYVVDKSLPRRFLNPKKFESFYNKLNTSGRINIGFPSSKTDDIIFAAEGGVYRKTSKGLKGFKLSRTAIEDIGDIVPIRDKTYYRTGLGGFNRISDDVVKPVIDLAQPKSNEWFKSVQQAYKYGYPTKTYVTESGKQIIDYASGFGKGISPPMPKNWISKAKYGLTKSKEATVSLIRKTKTTFGKIPSSSIKNIGVRTSIYTPIEMISPVIATSSLYLGSKVGVKTLETSLKPKTDFKYKPVAIQNIGSVKAYKTGTKTDIISDVIPIQTSEIKTKPMLKQDIIQKQELEYKPKLTYQPISTYTPMNTNPMPMQKKMLYGFPFIPPMGMGGRGRRGYSPGKLGKKYRFREFKIPTIGGLNI